MIHQLSALPDLLALQASAPRLFPLLLESAAPGARARFDLLLATDGSGLQSSAVGDVRALDGTPLTGGFIDALDREFARVGCQPVTGDLLDLPFNGGWALYLGYELAGEIEPSLRLPSGPTPLPCAQAWRCPVAVIIDRQQTRAYVVAESGHETLCAEVCALLDLPLPEVKPAQAVARVIEDAEAQFIDGVTRVIDYLVAGDVFQVNLSRGWTAQFSTAPNPMALYRRLRESSPAPFAGLLTADDWAVLSSSPERLVSRRGDRIETRPIAGTRARTQGDDDTARIRELVEHPKERAEHIMLIDLERNDLGRVCETGSVRVDALMEVESYADVHHIESTVSGRARAGLTPGQLIRALFPGGTITGCPKVRCMQIIAELEGVGRGPYTGAMGWLGSNGDLDLNILIRSAWLCGGQLGMRAGAGIVIDSDATFELAETRAKARGLLRALAASD